MGPSAREFQNFVEENLFRLLLELEVQKATRLQYCVSVVSLIPDLGWGDVDPSGMRRMAEVAVHQLRATDVVTTLSPSMVGLLLIAADTQTLPGIHTRVKEELETHPWTVGGQESRPTWSAGGSCYPQTATGGRDALRQAISLMARAKREGGDRLYLPA